MNNISAGLLMWKEVKGEIYVFLVHPGGPYWKEKEYRCWDIPKGEVIAFEDNFDAAKRKSKEETGISPPSEKEKYIFLGKIKRKDGKEIYIWAFEGEYSGILNCSSFVEIEYPKNSKKKIKFPEVDRAQFFSLEKAKEKVFPSLVYFLDKLKQSLK